MQIKPADFTRLKSDFNTVNQQLAELRAAREAIESERCALGDKIRELNATRPNRDELKKILLRVIEGFKTQWDPKLAATLESLKTGMPPEDFVARHVSISGDDEFVSAAGWWALLGHLLPGAVEGFVDNLADWPEGIAEVERQEKLAKLSREMEALTARVIQLDDLFGAIGAKAAA